MTQHQLVMEYVYEHGSILPAKMAGEVWNDLMFGSETTKRCRELKADGYLVPLNEGKFVRFYATDKKFEPTRATTAAPKEPRQQRSPAVLPSEPEQRKVDNSTVQLRLGLVLRQRQEWFS